MVARVKVRKGMKALCMVSILIFSVFVSTTGSGYCENKNANEKAKVVIRTCYFHTEERKEIEMDMEEAAELINKLNALQNSFINGDANSRKGIIEEIKKAGIISERMYGLLQTKFEDEIKSSQLLPCFFMLASNDGAAGFLPEIITAFLLEFILYDLIPYLFDIFPSIDYTPFLILISFMSHLIPFRFFMPLFIAELRNGIVFKIGLDGMEIHDVKSISLVISGGFVGIIISIFIPSMHFFSDFYLKGYLFTMGFAASMDFIEIIW